MDAVALATNINLFAFKTSVSASIQWGEGINY